jgi:TRAP-type C4-dicarboxylate transport system substrate-binding protein
MSRPATQALCFLVAAAALGLVEHAHSAQTQGVAVQRLRVVGGLAGVNQYVRHEAPFWTSRLERLSGGRYRAEIVPFDRAGIRGQEMLSMVKLGTVAFGTLLLSQSAASDLELGAPDLAGLNPDMASLRRSVAAYRPRLQQLLRERHGAELLAVYTYPAQVLFCAQPITSLESVRGRRVRTSSVSQADWVEALGGQPVSMPFAKVVDSVKAGRIDCAITGTMSGNTVGLHEVTTHLHTMAVNWGLSVFVVHGATWRGLPADLKSLLEHELPKLEASIWDEATRETAEGVACNTGAAACRTGTRGRMTQVTSTPADDQRRRDILMSTVLPRWLQRCGPGCVEIWNSILAPATGVTARPN